MYQIGDKVKIVGNNAVYGGLGGHAGVSVPAYVKSGFYTIMQVSLIRQECLLREIYSWVPFRYVELYIEAPSTNSATSKTSNVKSAIITSEAAPLTDTNRKKYVPYSVDAIDCYVKNLVTGVTTAFSISPETVTDNMVANFEDQVTKSRPSPFKAYSNSGPRDVSFTISLYDDYCDGGILKTVRKLQALTVPVNSGGYIKEPRCKVKIGKFIDMTAVCLSVSVEWAKPYKEGVYSKADVSFTFNEIEGTAKYATQWEEGT